MKTNRFGAVVFAAVCLAMGACSSDTKTADTGSDKAMAAKADNTGCPFSGGPVNASLGTVAVGGKNIGFCCAGCKGKFEAFDDAKRAEMVANMAKVK